MILRNHCFSNNLKTPSLMKWSSHFRGGIISPDSLHIHGIALLIAAGVFCSPQPLMAANDYAAVPGNAMQQEATVKGTVVGSDGMPLPGVTVKLKGTTIGTATDADGIFQIKVSNRQKAVLEFSYIGMKPKEVKVAGQNNLLIHMEDDNALLDEVMVVAYGTTTKEAFTGSAVSVKSDKITQAAASKTSAVEALRGNVAGVRFSNSGGQPGELSSIQIRGIGSINESTSPLYVVDGVTMSTSLNMINPADIESMTVLKDAAATSLYGNRASNGVIIITTKKGSAGKVKFTATYEHAWSSQSMPRSLKGFYMNTAELTEYSMEALRNRYLYNNKALPWQDNYDPNNQAMYNAAQDWALRNLHSTAKIVHPDDPLDGSFDYSTADLSKYFSNPRMDNWEDAYFRTGQEDKLNLQATGGNEKLNFYASLGYLNQKGIVIGSEFDRYTGRISVNGQLGRYIDFTIGENVGYTIRDEQTAGDYYNSPIAGMFYLNPSMPIYLQNGELNTKPGFNRNTPNHLHNLKHMMYRYKDMSSISNLSLIVKFTPWLNFRTVNGIDLNYTQEKQVWDREHLDGMSTNGMVFQYTSNYYKITTSNTLNLDKEIGKHSIKALLGYEAFKYQYDNFSATGQQFAYSDKMYLGNAATPSEVGGYEGSDRMVSWIAKADYGYDNRYYLSASYRRDGTSRFTRDNRWGNFWSVSGAWNMIHEKFMENTTAWLDNLRLKLSYGTNGNQPSGYWNNLNLFNIAARHNLNPAMMADKLGNKHLTWENSYTWNVGVDFSIFNSRLSGTVEYYNRKTTDLIDWTNVSYMTGWSEYIVNDGQLRNTGVEITLTSRNIDNGDFTWTTDFNISTMRAKIEKLNGGDRIDHPYIEAVGEHLYSFYTRQWAGVDSATGLPLWKKNTKDDYGNVIDNTSVTSDANEADRVIVGKGYPDWFGGMTNSFTYKGFELSFLLTFSLGGKMVDNTQYYGVRDGYNLGYQNYRRDVMGNYWTKPGDEARDPIVIYNNPLQPGEYTSDRRMCSSDYLRLKTLTFAYNLPQKWIGKIGVKGARVYVNGNDVLTFSHSKYVDPEIGLSGQSKSVFSFPMLKSWRVGLKLDF